MNKKTPLISVIIPVYNVEKYMDRCIESIVNQTYENLEIILVDDGSDDLSGNKCDQWRKKDNRIRVIHKINGGLSDARNAGLNFVKGELISFIDSDDYIDLHYYDILLGMITEYGCEIAGCDFREIYEDGCDMGHENSFFQLERKEFSGKEFLKTLCLGRTTQSYSVWKFLFKAEVIGDFRFIEGVYYEDVCFMTEVLYKASKVVCIHIPLYYYMRRRDSITGKQLSDKHIKDYIYVYNRQFQILEEKGDILLGKAGRIIAFSNLKLLIYKKKALMNLIKRELNEVKHDLEILSIRNRLKYGLILYNIQMYKIISSLCRIFK